MRRTRAPDNAVALPAMVDTEAGGYYTAGPPATVFSADDANMIQEELVAIAGLLGVALDTTGANTSQCATALAGIKAIVAKNAEATLVDTLWTMAVIASDDATVGEDAGGVVHCAVIASQVGSAKGFESAVIASTDARAGNAGGTSSSVAVIASEDVATEGDHSFIAAALSNSGTATSTASRGAIIASVFDSAGTKLSGTEVALIAVDDGVVTGYRCAIVGGIANTIVASSGTAIDCAIIGGDTNTIDGAGPAACGIVAGDGNNIAGGGNSGILGGLDNVITSGWNNGILGGEGNSIANGADQSAIVGCVESAVAMYASVAVASKFLDDDAGGSEANYMLCGGYHGTTPTGPSWLIRSDTGAIYATDTTVNAIDYAELFPNSDGKAHLPGQILARTGKGARLAKRGDRVLGGVSVTPTVLGGSDALGWNDMYLRDEWGAFIWADVEEVTERPDPSTIAEAARRLKADPEADVSDLDMSPRITKRMVKTRTDNPAYDRTRSKAHVPRTKRPDEWTAVGLLGQIRLRVDATVKAESFVVPGDEPGTGTHSDEPGRGRPIECMEIVSPFDARRGYAIAFCLVG